jgi:hypothetical protein
MCVDVLARWTLSDSIYVLFLALDVAPASPFIASKERAQVTFMVKR